MSQNRTESRVVAGIDRKAQHSAAKRAIAARLAREAAHAAEAHGEALAVAERFPSPSDLRMRRQARVEAELRLLAQEDGAASIQGFVGNLAAKLGGELDLKGSSRREADKVFGGGQ